MGTGAQIDTDERRLPRHVAIIMDGNRRWASRLGTPTWQGHDRGLTAAKESVRAARELGIPYISLFTFSTENWRRSSAEVHHLMSLVARLRDEQEFYREYEVRVVHSGQLEGLPPETQEHIRNTARETREHAGITVNLAVNYGGRSEIVRAVRRFLEQGNTLEYLSEETLAHHLDQPDMPDVDLLIRTGDRQRVSNFLLWQAAYAELVFVDTLWPEWSAQDFNEAIRVFQSRRRTFGGDKPADE